MKPERIQRKRTRGWKMPPNTVSVTRPGRYGNPFAVGAHAQTPTDAVRLFRGWLDGPARAVKVAWADELRGKNLACWCALVDKHGNPVPCHADVLLELANA